jgi:hypothetical protein
VGLASAGGEGAPRARGGDSAHARGATVVGAVEAPAQPGSFGWWIVPVLELVLLGTLIAQAPGRIDVFSRRASKLTVGLLVVLTIGPIAALAILMIDIIHVGLGVSAGVLLGRGAALWVTNVIVFSLWYWLFDRSGLARRANGAGVTPSFAFPQNAARSRPGGMVAAVRRLPTSPSRMPPHSAPLTPCPCAHGRRWP